MEREYACSKLRCNVDILLSHIPSWDMLTTATTCMEVLPTRRRVVRTHLALCTQIPMLYPLSDIGHIVPGQRQPTRKRLRSLALYSVSTSPSLHFPPAAGRGGSGAHAGLRAFHDRE